MTEEPVTITDPAYLLRLYAHAIAKRDCSSLDTSVPDEGHPMWQVWREEAEAVLEVRDDHLQQLRHRLEITIKGIKGPPVPDYVTAWAQLTSYVQEAVDDGGTIEPAALRDYMRELKRAANAPTRAWFDAVMNPRDTTED